MEIYSPLPPLLPFPIHKTARKQAERDAKESAKRFQVNATIATKTAEEFKSLGEKQKAAKKESIETAKLNKGAGVIVSVHDVTLDFKKMQDDRVRKKKEAKETAMQYNYTYGDGGVVDKTSAEFLANQNAIKAKKKESIETAMQYNYTYGDGGIVDETSAEFLANQNAIKAKKKESVETAMQYNYNYGDGGVVDQTSAEFLANQNAIKAKKKESVYPR